MGRSEWMLLLLIPMLFGFDTRNPFRTRGPFRTDNFTIGGGGGGGGCTDGVDCYCDTVSDGSLIFCEDFEDLDFYENTARDWATSPGGSPGDRGLGSEWIDDYGCCSTGYWTTGTPAAPKLGSVCSPSGQVCGYKEYCSDSQSAIVLGEAGSDCWDGNSGSAIDIQRSGDFLAEVGSLTLTGGTGDSADVGAGKAHLAYRISAGSSAGIIGGKFFTNKTHIGVTEAVAYASNYIAVGSTTAQVKGDEWGDYPYSEWWMYGNMTGNGLDGIAQFPFQNWLWLDPSATQADCQAAVAAATVHKGEIATCDGSKMYFGAKSGQYTQSTDWPLGTWACVQGEAIWTGTAPNRFLEMKVWVNELLVIHFSGLSSEFLANDDGYDEFYLNNFTNANDPGPPDPTTGTTFRYKDNLHVRNGAPVACSAIGF